MLRRNGRALHAGPAGRSTGYTGDAPGVHDTRLPITFGGQASFLNFIWSVAAFTPAGENPSSGSAQIDVTLRFRGYVEARDAAGNPVAFSICTNLPT